MMVSEVLSLSLRTEMVTLSHLALLGLSFGLSYAVQLTVPPTAQYVGNGQITGTLTFGPSNPTSGPGTPASHVIQFRDLTAGTAWQDLTAPQSYPSGNFFYTYSIFNVNVGNVYQVRDILIDQQGNRYGDDGVPSTRVNTGNIQGSSTPGPNVNGLRFTSAPQANYDGIGQITATLIFGNNNPVLGNGIPQYYILQYRDQTTGQSWVDSVRQSFPTGQNIQQTYTITGLAGGDVYNVRAIIEDVNGVRYGGNQVPYIVVTTGNIDSNGNIQSSNLQSSNLQSSNQVVGNCIQLTLPPSAQNTGFGTINANIQLGPNNPVQGSGIPSFFIFQYRDLTNNGPWTDWGANFNYPVNSQTNQQQTTQITGLSSGVVYGVRVIVFNAAGQRCDANTVPSTTVGTQCNVPQTTVDTNTVATSLDVNARVLTVTWNYNPQVDSQSCQLLGYQVLYTYNGITQTDTVPGPTIDFSNYTQGFPITLQIRPVWSGGYGVYSQQVTVPRNIGK